jgi:predicted O-methyltransferase YrrM
MRHKECSDIAELNEIARRSAKHTDINDHLTTIFTEALAVKPRLIVELGVRSGESTFVLERVAGLCDAYLISVDFCDCSQVSAYDKWTFVCREDIEFAREFGEWCASQGIAPHIDVLFIDTSHLYEHTVKEIDAYFPFLSACAVVLFHDTNLKRLTFRKNGSVCLGTWNNKRGVIRAIEKYFNSRFNEKRDFVALQKGWLIKHFAYCNGLTVLRRNFHCPE